MPNDEKKEKAKYVGELILIKIKTQDKRISELKTNQNLLGRQNLDFMEQIAELKKILQELLDKYSENEDSNIHRKFFKRLSVKLSNPTLGDGIPVDARYPATDINDGEKEEGS